MLEHRRLRTVERSPVAEPVERTLAKAVAHRAAGRFQKARQNLQRVLDAAPDHAVAHYELGVLTRRIGTPGPAVPHFVAALRSAPERPAYWLALATILLEAGRVSEARTIIERFQMRGFADADTRTVLEAFVQQAFTEGRARYDRNDFAAAEALFDLVLGLDETHADATYLAGAVAARTNRLQRAFDLFSIAIYRDPKNAAYFCTLGALLTTMNDLDGAVSALEKAIEFDPALAVAHANIAGAYRQRGEFGLALTHARQAIEIDPACTSAYINLGSCLKHLGRLPEAVEAYDTVLAFEPTNVAAYSNRLFAKLYAAGASLLDYAADARAFGERLADPLLRQRPFRNDRDPDRRLRIGFVSGDLFGHAIVRFLEPFLQHLDRASFEARAYMTRGQEDAVSEHLRGLFDGWHNIAGLSDDEAADLIEADAIDVLIDLSGHSAGHRLLVFARKPAPVQVSYLGHPATTGLRAMDYRLTDSGLDVLGESESLHTETVWWLPGVSATYRPPDGIPDVRSGMPFDDNGFITFGVLNRFEKIGDLALRTWADILDALPEARLFMVVGDIDAPEVRAQIEARLSGAGLPLDRVRLHPRVGAGYFKLYHEVDISLDSFPYNGGTTSCDTLCMGVPYIALQGSHAVARVGSSLLATVGLAELTAEIPEDYAARAIALASDPDRLRAIRSGLRERVFASPLMDHARFAREMGDAFRTMWRRWIETTRSA